MYVYIYSHLKATQLKLDSCHIKRYFTYLVAYLHYSALLLVFFHTYAEINERHVEVSIV